MKTARGGCTQDLCDWMRSQLTKGEFEIFAVHTWAVWREKQNFLHDVSKQLIAENVSWCRALLADFYTARLAEQINETAPRSQSNKKWKRPDSSVLKLNVDACVNEALNRYSVGGVLRDRQGRLLLAFGKQISQPLSVVHGELLAIREGVKLLYEKNFQDVQVATDSLLVVQAVTATRKNLGYDGIYVSEISTLMKAPVISGFTYENRLANSVARKVAHFASSSHSSFTCVNGEFLSWLIELVMNNVS